MIIGIDASRTTVNQHTGTESYAFNLIRALLERIPHGGDTRVRLYFNHTPVPGHFPEHPNVENVIIPFPRMWTHVRLAQELHLKPPDVFFTPAHVIPFSYYRPSVATVHDLGYHYFPDAHPATQLNYLRWSTRHNARRAKHVLADSQATKSDLEALYQIPAEKISVVYPALDPDFEREISQTGHLQSEPKHPYILFLSTIQPRKNVSRIVKAFARIASHCPHNLIIAGKLGWMSDPILEEINALDQEVQNRIFLPGFVSKEGKVPLMAGADALVYPSLYEGFGFPMLEANACGTAVIASNTSSLAEVGANGSALLVDPQSVDEIEAAMLRILMEPGVKRSLVEKGLENVSRFSWDKAAAQTLDVLMRVAQTGRGSPTG